MISNKELKNCCNYDNWLSKAILKIKADKKPKPKMATKKKKTDYNDYDGGDYEEQEIDDKTEKILNKEKNAITISVYSCSHHSCSRGSVSSQDLIFTYDSKLYHFSHTSFNSGGGGSSHDQLTAKVIAKVEDICS